MASGSTTTPTWADATLEQREALSGWVQESLAGAAWASKSALMGRDIQFLVAAPTEDQDDDEVCVRTRSICVLQGRVAPEHVAAKEAWLTEAGTHLSEIQDRTEPLLLKAGDRVSELDAPLMRLDPEAPTEAPVPVSLAAFEGSTVLLHFYELFAEEADAVDQLQAMTARMSEAWAEDVVVCAISLDEFDDHESIAELASKRGWRDVVHLWAGPEGGFSPAAEALGVTSGGVAILIDAEGSVVWMGPPHTIDMANEITALVAGTSTLAARNAGNPFVRDLDAEAEAENAGPWWRTRDSEATRLSEMKEMRDACVSAGLEFDSFVSETVAVMTGERAAVDSQLSLIGSFPSTQSEALGAMLAEISERVGDADVSQVDVYPVAAPVVPAETCGLCGTAVAQPGDDMPAMVCIHCEPTETICAGCYWEQDRGGHDPAHTFAMVRAGASASEALRHGPGTWPADNPADDPESTLEGQHISVQCDACMAHPLPVARFKCAVCADYDLCSACHAAWSQSEDGVVGEVANPGGCCDTPSDCCESQTITLKHPTDHVFLVLRADLPSSS